jgi:hypothetical protein
MGEKKMATLQPSFKEFDKLTKSKKQQLPD